MNNQQLFLDLYFSLYQKTVDPSKPDSVETEKSLCLDLAERLNRIAKREDRGKRLWGLEAIRNILRGRQEAGKEMVRAGKILAGRIDGQSPVQARLRELTVYSTNGLQDEAIIIAHLIQKRCDYEGCGLEFWGHPNRKYCCDEHGRKARWFRNKTTEQ